MDDSLRLDSGDSNALSDSLSHYFADNDTADVAPATVWAAHKCVIRGEIISLMAKRHNLRKAHITELSNRVKTLECSQTYSRSGHSRYSSFS